MKKMMSEISNEVKEKWAYWHNLQSRKVKAAFIVLFFALIALKVFTTTVTIEWIMHLFA